jgi:hypothetical protein
MINIKNVTMKWFFLVVVTGLSCSPQKHIESKISGVFKSEIGRELTLKNQQFYLVLPQPNGHSPCCDTIAIGDYSAEDKGYLIFNSPIWLSRYFVAINVNETVGKDSDSLYFIINTPIELSYRSRNPDKAALNYIIELNSRGGSGDPHRRVYSDKNILAFKKDGGQNLKFSLFLEPKLDMYADYVEQLHLMALDYKIENSQANVFEIEVPRLDYSFLRLRRLKDDYVKIVNKDHLRWDGVDYVRN